MREIGQQLQLHDETEFKQQITQRLKEIKGKQPQEAQYIHDTFKEIYPHLNFEISQSTSIWQEHTNIVAYCGPGGWHIRNATTNTNTHTNLTHHEDLKQTIKNLKLK